MTGPADYFALGDWNILCAQCGRKLKASQAVKNWQGTWRCPEHNEVRHPQDFVRALRNEGQAAPFVQRPADIDARFCTVQTRRGIAGVGEAGCAVPFGTNDRSRSLTGVEATGQVAQTISTTAIQTAAAAVSGVQGAGQTSSNLSITGVANPVVNPGTVKGTGAAGALTTTQTGDQGITGVSATGVGTPVTAFGELNLFANISGVSARGNLSILYAKQGYTITVGANAAPASSATRFGFDSRTPVYGALIGNAFYGGAQIKALYSQTGTVLIAGVPSYNTITVVMAGTLPITHFNAISAFANDNFNINRNVNTSFGYTIVFTQTGTETIWEFRTSLSTNCYDLGCVGKPAYLRFYKPYFSSFPGEPDPPPI